MPSSHTIVIGGGIVGLATAYALQRRSRKMGITVLEKERTVAAHQTGRNSGVIHSGLYYAPGSVKADTCRRGKAMLEAFCREHGVAFALCGKVIVATRKAELPGLARLLERGTANGVVCERIGAAQLAEIEPYVAGVGAIRVPEAGIVDYAGVCRELVRLIEQAGGTVRTGVRVVRIQNRAAGCCVETTRGDFVCSGVVACAGLHADRVAAMTQQTPPAPPHPLRPPRPPHPPKNLSPVQIVPFRGEYYELTPDARHLCNGLVYPVPDPRFPFLGVHFTRMIGGGVECGPNAVLACAREGYSWGDVEPDDLAEILGSSACWKLFARHWRMGLGEIRRSLSKRAFTHALQRLIPEIRAEHLVRAPAGVRAQALAPDGSLVDDFLFVRDGRVVHVCNAPSPAATGALAIGERIAGMVVA